MPCFEIFEDNEAVIKIIIKGTNPTMRHVSRTHRVALDWLFERINLDRKIQIKYVDTQKKTSRRHFDERQFHSWWLELSSLFNIMNNSVISLSHFNQTNDPQATSRRQIQEGKQGGKDERVVAKSRPAPNLVSVNVNRSPTVPSSSSSQRPQNLTANCSTLDSLTTWETKRDGFEWEQRIRLSSAVHRHWPEFQHRETCCEKEKGWLPVDHVCSLTIWPYCQAVSRTGRKSSHKVRQKLGRSKEDKVEQVYAEIWGLYVCVHEDSCTS